MQRIIKQIFFAEIVWLVSKINEDRKNIKLREEKDKLIFKQEEVLRTYEKWMSLVQSDQKISKYLQKCNYRNIAIYGLGRLGKQLYNEVLSSDINITYIVDKSYGLENKYYNQTRCYLPEEILPTTDLIIITVPSEATDIGIQLRKKLDCPIKSINEILFVMK